MVSISVHIFILSIFIPISIYLYHLQLYLYHPLYIKLSISAHSAAGPSLQALGKDSRISLLTSKRQKKNQKLKQKKKHWNSTNKEPGNTTEIQIKIAMRVNILFFLLFLF